MKLWRLFSGIVSILLYSIVISQSKLAFVVEKLGGQEGKEGTAGTTVAYCMLIGGIASLFLFWSKGKLGSIILAVIFGIGAIAGYSNAGFFKDLLVWATWCLICALMALDTIVVEDEKKKKAAKKAAAEAAAAEAASGENAVEAKKPDETDVNKTLE